MRKAQEHEKRFSFERAQNLQKSDSITQKNLQIYCLTQAVEESPHRDPLTKRVNELY